MFQVSNSKINTWRRCHYSYYLKYVEKIVRKRKEGPLQRGIIIHSCLEAYNSNKSWKKPFKVFEEGFYKTTFAEERVELGDIPAMVKELMENYIHYYEEDELEYIENEQYFELPLTSEIELVGYIDAVVEDVRGKVWPMDYKTFARSPDRDTLIFNAQAANYIWALTELGYTPEGMIWDIIKAKEPTRPKLTAKTQKMSQAKLDSTPYTIIKGIKELGLDPNEFHDFINKHDYESYFQRHFIRLNKRVVDSIMEDTVSTAKQMLEQGETLKDRNLSRDCSWCSYKSICQAELLGLDVDYIIEAEYEPKKSREVPNDKEKEKKKTGSKKSTRNRR